MSETAPNGFCDGGLWLESWENLRESHIAMSRSEIRKSRAPKMARGGHHLSAHRSVGLRVLPGGLPGQPGIRARRVSQVLRRTT